MRDFDKVHFTLWRTHKIFQNNDKSLVIAGSNNLFFDTAFNNKSTKFKHFNGKNYESEFTNQERKRKQFHSKFDRSSK